MLADWSIRAPRETPGGPLNFNFPKNFDTSCSMGPCIAVGEADPTNIDMETLVNGECRQRFNTRDMVFTFGEYLEYLSRDFTLYPGDVISGGTAAGTAADSVNYCRTRPLHRSASLSPEMLWRCGPRQSVR